MKQDLFNPEPEAPSMRAHVVAWILIACLIALAVWPLVNFYLITIF